MCLCLLLVLFSSVNASCIVHSRCIFPNLFQNSQKCILIYLFCNFGHRHAGLPYYSINSAVCKLQSQQGASCDRGLGRSPSQGLGAEPLQHICQFSVFTVLDNLLLGRTNQSRKSQEEVKDQVIDGTHVALMSHWCVTAVSLMCHCCGTDVALMCHWCVTDVALRCHWCVTAVTMMWH